MKLIVEKIKQYFKTNKISIGYLHTFNDNENYLIERFPLTYPLLVYNLKDDLNKIKINLCKVNKRYLINLEEENITKYGRLVCSFGVLYIFLENDVNETYDVYCSDNRRIKLISKEIPKESIILKENKVGDIIPLFYNKFEKKYNIFSYLHYIKNISFNLFENFISFQDNQDRKYIVIYEPKKHIKIYDSYSSYNENVIKVNDHIFGDNSIKDVIIYGFTCIYQHLFELSNGNKYFYFGNKFYKVKDRLLNLNGSEVIFSKAKVFFKPYYSYHFEEYKILNKISEKYTLLKSYHITNNIWLLIDNKEIIQFKTKNDYVEYNTSQKIEDAIEEMKYKEMFKV